jgi:uncharacterized protein (DUF924 family)
MRGMSAHTSPNEATPILDFWFGDGLQLGWPSDDRNALWFRGGPALDADITQRFGPLVLSAVQGGLTEWEADPLQRLALIVLLDQFTRNVFRGQAQAFAGDARAQTLSLATLALGQDSALPTVANMFVLMPLMHAEHRLLQAACEQRFRALQARSDAATAQRLQGNVDAAVQHRAIVDQFGRFPHRNATLGRASTAEETAFLTHGPRFGQ